MLTVVLELADEAGKAVELGDLGAFFAVEATVDGRPAQAKPAIGPLGHPSSWQTWRLAVEPGSPARRFALRIIDVEGKRKWSNKEKNPAEAQHRFSAYFLPQS